MHYAFVIAMTAQPEAAARFQDQLDDLIIGATMAGGIDSLTSDEREGPLAQQVLDHVAAVLQPTQLVEAVIRATGQVILVPLPADEPQIALDMPKAHRLARLGRVGAPETRPDDGLDRHAEHKKLRQQQEGKKQ